MTRPDTQQAEAIALLRRDAKAGKTGAAAAYSRELRRRDREGQIVTKREIQAEHQRRTTTSRHNLEDDDTTAKLAGLNTKLFDEHNKNGACQCAAVCLPHAEAVLQSLLLSDEDFHALYENEREHDG
jgi:hypothetical protein